MRFQEILSTSSIIQHEFINSSVWFVNFLVLEFNQFVESLEKIVNILVRIFSRQKKRKFLFLMAKTTHSFSLYFRVAIIFFIPQKLFFAFFTYITYLHFSKFFTPLIGRRLSTLLSISRLWWLKKILPLFYYFSFLVKRSFAW